MKNAAPPENKTTSIVCVDIDSIRLEFINARIPSRNRRKEESAKDDSRGHQ